MAVKGIEARSGTLGFAREACLSAATVGDGLRGRWSSFCFVRRQSRDEQLCPTQVARARWAHLAWSKRLLRTGVGFRCVVGQHRAMLTTRNHLAGKGRQGVPGGLALTARQNMSIDTDPQQQEAASPLVLVVRSSSRYTSWR
jgi:hypothetical protein